MDLQTRKKEFIQEFLKVQSENIVVRLEKRLKEETSKAGNKDIKPFAMDELSNRINKSMLDSMNDKVTENKELLAEKHKWH